MKKLSILILFLSFCIICGCSKENPTSLEVANNNNIADGKKPGYYLDLIITQHPSNGSSEDIVLVYESYYTSSMSSITPEINFSTEDINSTFTIKRTVAWINVPGICLAHWIIAGANYDKAYQMTIGSGYYETTDEGYLSPGQDYTCWFGTAIITDK